jgi:hypothetical protein
VPAAQQQQLSLATLDSHSTLDLQPRTGAGTAARHMQTVPVAADTTASPTL